jgi:hypothetical protein
MARQEERRHEVPVEKPLIRDERARQERYSNRCDGGLYYYPRPERFAAPVMHRRHIRQKLTFDISVKRVMAGHASTDTAHTITYHRPITKVLKRTAVASERFQRTFFFNSCVAPRGTILALSSEKVANLTK